jgi:hypothetical protein
MYSEAKKLHIIEEVLKVKNETTLSALENLLRKSKKDKTIKSKAGFSAFSGIWSNDEAEEIKKIIAESCETIDPNDWE